MTTFAASLTVDVPAWALEMGAACDPCLTDDARMAFAVALSRENVRRGDGGPFGAAVFEETSGALVSIGVNSVRRLENCALHAEVSALMFAGQAVGCHNLSLVNGRAYVLATSCDPCAMCLGAVLWSGVPRVLCGATREDAMTIGFDEGPVFPASMTYLADRGVQFVHGLRRAEARAVLEAFVAAGGALY